MITCPNCGVGEILQEKSEVKYNERWHEIIIHDGFLVCTNGPKCSYRFNMSESDRYGTRMAVSKQVSQNPIFLSRGEFVFLFRTLTMYAGINNEFAGFLSFVNFSNLEKLKINFKRLAFELSYDERMFMSPFYHEAADLIAQKFGFKHADDLSSIIGSGEIVSVKLDRTIKQLMRMVEKIDYPRASGELRGASYVVHLYY